MSSKREYYEVLCVSREATSDELRKAYRREAMKHHPDRNPGDASAEAKFKEVNEAYQVLSDEQKRRIYDQFGHAGLDGSTGRGGRRGYRRRLCTHAGSLRGDVLRAGWDLAATRDLGAAATCAYRRA